MQIIQSRHPPGAVCMVTGDDLRSAIAMQSVVGTYASPGSLMTWFSGVLVSSSLNESFQAVLHNSALQWAWVMGDDHVYNPDAVLKLLDREVDVIVPLCLSRAPPFNPVISVRTEGGFLPKPLGSLPRGGLYKLAPNESCGDAGMLIRRHVLEKIEPPWYNNRRSGSYNSDDQAFVARLIQEGFDVHVDLDVQIGHVTQTVVVPALTQDGWKVRMIGSGAKHIADFRPKQ